MGTKYTPPSDDDQPAKIDWNDVFSASKWAGPLDPGLMRPGETALDRREHALRVRQQLLQDTNLSITTQRYLM